VGRTGVRTDSTLAIKGKKPVFYSSPSSENPPYALVLQSSALSKELDQPLPQSKIRLTALQ